MGRVGSLDWRWIARSWHAAADRRQYSTAGPCWSFCCDRSWSWWWWSVWLFLAICSPRFREWIAAIGQQPIHYIHYQGLRFAPEIAVHPCHSWARIKGQRADIGVDDLVQSTLGPVEKVELPRVGTWCCQGDPLFTLRRGDRVLQVRSPMSGTVEAINRELLDLPDLINQTPFTEGWAVRMRAERMEQECEGSVARKAGRRVVSWRGRSIDWQSDVLRSDRSRVTRWRRVGGGPAHPNQ